MATRYVRIDDAPPPPATARYSHAVEAGGALYVTGQLPIDPLDTNAPLPDSIEKQAERVFSNLRLIVEAAGYSLNDTVFVRIYLSNFDRDYAGLNAVYDRQFPDHETLPARTTIGVSRLGGGALVEIDLTLTRTDAEAAQSKQWADTGFEQAANQPG
ncbi:RidA family protein [Pararhizobium sp. LjRoot238]|uniref:RidA family protein n=1 Tax=Pararhizobium sp. LjRoot238 TaxID=3342293 RepID=UPI003ECE6206